jgi:hypothetical protein
MGGDAGVGAWKDLTDSVKTRWPRTSDQVRNIAGVATAVQGDLLSKSPSGVKRRNPRLDTMNTADRSVNGFASGNYCHARRP